MNRVANKYVRLAAAALSVMFLTTAALEAKGGHRDPEKHLQKMKKHLGLSDQQVVQIRAIHKKYEARHKELREKMQAMRKSMHEMIMSDSPDRSALQSKMQEACATKVERRMVWFDQHREVHALLNPAQKAKMKKHMEERHKNRKGKGMRKGKHGGKCGC